MIAEYLTAISTSPWNNDHFHDFESTEINNSVNYYDSKLTSRGTSRRTSECSDRDAELFCMDNWYSDYESVVVRSAESFLPDITLVNSSHEDDDNFRGFVSPNLTSHHEISDDDGGVSSLDSNVEDESDDEDDEIYPSPKKSKRNLHDVTWSEMSKEEHIRTIEQLISLISEQMNLRDQLEIIRIIKPNAEVSPTANEFTIELEWLTDEKLHRIRDYITQTSKDGNSKSTKEDTDEEEDEQSSTKSMGCGKSRRSKRCSNERRQQMRAQRLRQRKENKQAVKEKKSGLFRNEKVLSVERCQDDCEEVDILG